MKSIAIYGWTIYNGYAKRIKIIIPAPCRLGGACGAERGPGAGRGGGGYQGQGGVAGGFSAGSGLGG